MRGLIYLENWEGTFSPPSTATSLELECFLGTSKPWNAHAYMRKIRSVRKGTLTGGRTSRIVTTQTIEDMMSIEDMLGSEEQRRLAKAMLLCHSCRKYTRRSYMEQRGRGDEPPVAVWYCVDCDGDPRTAR